MERLDFEMAVALPLEHDLPSTPSKPSLFLHLEEVRKLSPDPAAPDSPLTPLAEIIDYDYEMQKAASEGEKEISDNKFGEARQDEFREVEERTVQGKAPLIGDSPTLSNRSSSRARSRPSSSVPSNLPVRTKAVAAAPSPSITASTSNSSTRYSIRRVTKNSKTNPHVITVTPGFSDGNVENWPTLISPSCLKTNRRYYRAIDRGEPKDLDWRLKLGHNFAVGLNLNTQLEFWILDEYPELYKMYDRQTTSEQQGSVIRHDTFLFGPYGNGKEFRSPAEYSGHLWSQLTEAAICHCKYCPSSGTKQYQRTINSILGIGSHLPSRGGQKVRSVSHDIGVDSGVRVVKTLRKKVVPIPKKKESNQLKESRRKKAEPVVQLPSPPPQDTREITYDGAYPDQLRDADMREGVIFREGELVWARLATPITDASVVAITRWPAIVMERKSVLVGSMLSKPLESGHAPHLTTTRELVYSVAYLACADVAKVREEDLIPWLSYLPDDNPSVETPNSLGQVWNGEEIIEAQLSNLVDVDHASTAWALALEIASEVTAGYSLADRFNVTAKDVTPALDPTTASSTELADRDQYLKYDQFQSFWWGAERIRVGDFIRVLQEPGPLDGTDAAGFMKLSSIFTIDQKARLSGTLYRLSASPLIPVATISTDVAPTSLAIDIPQPPLGYTFERVTPFDQVVTCDITCVASRYYPLPPHLATRSDLGQIAQLIQESWFAEERQAGSFDMEAAAKAVGIVGVDVEAEKRSLGLAGLLPTPFIFSWCERCVVDRHGMLEDAHRVASSAMIAAIGL